MARSSRSGTGWKVEFNELDTMMAEVRQRAGSQVKAATARAEAGAIKEAPVDTGHLRASVGSQFHGIKSGTWAEVYDTAEYAVFVHEGARGRPERPFLRDPAEREWAGVERRIAKSIEEIGR